MSRALRIVRPQWAFGQTRPGKRRLAELAKQVAKIVGDVFAKRFIIDRAKSAADIGSAVAAFLFVRRSRRRLLLLVIWAT